MLASHASIPSRAGLQPIPGDEHVLMATQRVSLRSSDEFTLSPSEDGLHILVDYHDGLPAEELVSQVPLDCHVSVTMKRAMRGNTRNVATMAYWLNLHTYCRDVVDEGVYSPHAQLLVEHFQHSRMGASGSPDPGLINFGRPPQFFYSFLNKLADSATPVVSCVDVSASSGLFKTQPWALQWHFVSHALRIEKEGVRMKYFDYGMYRIANLRGDELFVNQLCRRIEHRDDVKPKEHTFHGGFLIDKIGVGKTFSMLTLCAMHQAPMHFHLDAHGKPRRMPSGRIASRASLILCPSHVCSHWRDQIAFHLAQASSFKVLIIATKREQKKYTYADVICADFVIVSFNFVQNQSFRAAFDEFGPMGWNNYETRLNTALHTTKRRRADAFIDENQLSLPQIHFWRLIVDEYHELDLYSNRSMWSVVMCLEAHYRWAVSASLLSEDRKMINHIQFLVPCNSDAYKGLTHDIDCLTDIAVQLFLKAPPGMANEMTLPAIRQEVHWLEFTPNERRIYNSFHHSTSAQIRACCMPKLTNSEVPNVRTCTNVEDALAKIKEFMVHKLNHAARTVDQIRAMRTHLQSINPFDDDRVLRANIAHAERQLVAAERNREEARLSLEFINRVDIAHQECPICLEPTQTPTIISCGHVLCNACSLRIISMPPENRKCPQCRALITPSSNIVSVVRPGDECPTVDSLVETHGTKVAAIIRFIQEAVREDPSEKFVIFSRYDMLLHEVGQLLRAHIKVLYVKGSRDIKMKAINTFMTSAEHPILMLSAQYTASGVNLSVARNIIVLDVSLGSAQAAIENEKQVIGRVYRPPQNRTVRLHRFLVRDTVEHEQYDNVLSSIDFSSVWAIDAV